LVDAVGQWTITDPDSQTHRNSGFYAMVVYNV